MPTANFGLSNPGMSWDSSPVCGPRNDSGQPGRTGGTMDLSPSPLVAGRKAARPQQSASTLPIELPIMASPMNDNQIARSVPLRPITEIGGRIGIGSEYLLPFGHHIAKISRDFIESIGDEPDGKLILMTGVSPTSAGEGKTTTTVGLGDALNRIGKRAVICLREPSLGPCFGVKGGATGGGYAQVVPTNEINLHFTGDFHAVTAAHNLLSAMTDNHVHWGNESGLDLRRVAWRRVLDVNDRALRHVATGLGGAGNGFPRETGFDITAASELMAILCLASDVRNLERRISQIIVGYRRDRTPVLCRDINAAGAMTVLLDQALNPNLVQTLEHNPAIVHGGPFGNIAHGCNSVIATRAALKLADYVVTEAGFGADLGAEKFFNIKCRQAGLKPACAVVVATVRAVKLNGGARKSELNTESVAAVQTGCPNLCRQIENVRQFGLPVIVAVNRFSSDTPAETAAIQEYVSSVGTESVVCRHWAEGGHGAEDLARLVAAMVDRCESRFEVLYPDDIPLLDKIRTIAQRIYGARDVSADRTILSQLRSWEKAGYGKLPICIAKTQYSFTADPKVLGAPTGHVLPIREVRLSAGAGYVVAICGEMMTMPGLPRRPAAEAIFLDEDGLSQGLF